MSRRLFLLLFAVFFSLSAAFVPGYDLNVTSTDPLCGGFSGTLQRRADSKGPYGGDVDQLIVAVTCETENTARVRIYDVAQSRWQVPLKLQPTQRPKSCSYAVKYTTSPFSIKITRLEDGATLFDSTPSTSNGLIFEDQYIEWSTHMDSSAPLFGMGERKFALRLAPGIKYQLWNRGPTGTEYLSGLYGYHPFLLALLPAAPGSPYSYAHGIFMLSSNAMDFDYAATAKDVVSWKMIGGIVDMFVFTGPDPEAVVRQYHALVGATYMPPYWSLGWHQSRWGYWNVGETKAVVDKYKKNGLPLDTVWNDIEYMDNYHDFTTDPSRYPHAEMGAFLDQLHAAGQHYVMILDPGIAPKSGYGPYVRGNEAGVWIRDKNGAYLRNTCWPGLALFPDWTHPNTTAWWGGNLDELNSFLKFDGVWLDMNEPCTFCDGVCSEKPVTREPGSVGFNPDAPPYVPGGKRLDSSTLSLSGQHYAGLHYDLHTMYGLQELEATVAWMAKAHPERRPFVLCRSTFPSAGSLGAHWTGDNSATYEDMAWSIPAILSLNMFGVAHVGADICGFEKDTTEELCTRWMELGSFYPFSRNHNSLGQRSQEPYAFGDTLLNASRTALTMRYRILPFLYTAFWQAHTQGGTVAQPLFFVAQHDPNTWSLDRQFLLGSALLVTPVLVKGATSVTGYLPSGAWYDLWTFEKIVSKGANYTFPAPIDHIPLHIRGGTVLPTQEPALTSAEARRHPFTLIVAPDTYGSAKGSIHLDDGGLHSSTQSASVSFDVSLILNAVTPATSSLLVRPSAWTPATATLSDAIAMQRGGDPDWSTIQVDSVVYLGAPGAPVEVTLNGAVLDPARYVYDAKTGAVTVKLDQRAMILGDEVERWFEVGWRWW